MKHMFWNIRGMNKPGRNLILGQMIRAVLCWDS
jgi:hypothetical protein